MAPTIEEYQKLLLRYRSIIEEAEGTDFFHWAAWSDREKQLWLEAGAKEEWLDVRLHPLAELNSK